MTTEEYIYSLERENKRLISEGKTMRKALEDIEQMEPGLLDSDSSCDMSAVVAGNALAALVSTGQNS